MHLKIEKRENGNYVVTSESIPGLMVIHEDPTVLKALVQAVLIDMLTKAWSNASNQLQYIKVGDHNTRLQISKLIFEMIARGDPVSEDQRKELVTFLKGDL